MKQENSFKKERVPLVSDHEIPNDSTIVGEKRVDLQASGPLVSAPKTAVSIGGKRFKMDSKRT